jgi:hypothetical protein
MPRRLLFVLALLFVADAIVVNGRAPRPIVRSGEEILEVVRLSRLLVFTVS